MGTIYSERLFVAFENELGPCADELGITREIFHRPDVEIPIDRYFRLLEWTARKSCPNIGMRMGCLLRPGDLGALGHAAASAATLGEAFGVLSEYLYVLSHANLFRVDMTEHHAIVGYHLTDPEVGLHRQDVELVVCSVAGFAQQLRGDPRLHPARVDIEHAKPRYAQALRDVLRCELRFECGGNRLYYPKQVLDLPVVSADPSLFEALKFFLDDRIKVRDEDENLEVKVRHLIASRLAHGTPDIEWVARRLALSARTLQRRLAEGGLVFREMLDEVRKNIALDYIDNKDFSVTDIALTLGYGELSAFSRAFKRWTGRGPLERQAQSNLGVGKSARARGAT